MSEVRPGGAGATDKKVARRVPAWVSTVLLCAVGTACGPESFEPETWMIGTFSGATQGLGCTSVDQLTRYVVHEDGRFDIIVDSGGAYYAEWRATWEQREPGQYRVMRDDDYADIQFYPIEEGTDWEVTRSNECVEGPYSYVWHDIDQIDLVTGERKGNGGMTLGAMCPIRPEAGEMCSPDYKVVWCEGTEPIPECDPKK